MIHAIELPVIEQRIGAYNYVHAVSFRNEVAIYLAGFKPDQRLRLYGGTYDKPEQKAHGFSRGMNANTVMILR